MATRDSFSLKKLSNKKDDYTSSYKITTLQTTMSKSTTMENLGKPDHGKRSSGHFELSKIFLKKNKVAKLKASGRGYNGVELQEKQHQRDNKKIEDTNVIEKDEIETTQDFGNNETIKVLNEEITDSPEIQTAIDSIKKQKNIQTTPTSTLDDGYESSNSTPQVSDSWD